MVELAPIRYGGQAPERGRRPRARVTPTLLLMPDWLLPSAPSTLRGWTEAGPGLAVAGLIAAVGWWSLLSAGHQCSRVRTKPLFSYNSIDSRAAPRSRSGDWGQLTCSSVARAAVFNLTEYDLTADLNLARNPPTAPALKTSRIDAQNRLGSARCRRHRPSLRPFNRHRPDLCHGEGEGRPHRRAGRQRRLLRVRHLGRDHRGAFRQDLRHQRARPPVHRAEGNSRIAWVIGTSFVVSLAPCRPTRPRMAWLNPARYTPWRRHTGSVLVAFWLAPRAQVA